MSSADLEKATGDDSQPPPKRRTAVRKSSYKTPGACGQWGYTAFSRSRGHPSSLDRKQHVSLLLGRANEHAIPDGPSRVSLRAYNRSVS